MSVWIGVSSAVTCWGGYAALVFLGWLVRVMA